MPIAPLSRLHPAYEEHLLHRPDKRSRHPAPYTSLNARAAAITPRPNDARRRPPVTAAEITIFKIRVIKGKTRAK